MRAAVLWQWARRAPERGRVPRHRSGRQRPLGGDGGVRPEMGLHGVFTPVKRDPGCSFGMDLGWG